MLNHLPACPLIGTTVLAGVVAVLTLTAHVLLQVDTENQLSAAFVRAWYSLVLAERRAPGRIPGGGQVGRDEPHGARPLAAFALVGAVHLCLQYDALQALVEEHGVLWLVAERARAAVAQQSAHARLAEVVAATAQQLGVQENVLTDGAVPLLGHFLNEFGVRLSPVS